MSAIHTTKPKTVGTSAPVSRTADYAIQGFLYQFNKTILSILESADNAEIVVEGVIEDIDIHDAGRTQAIQCKYHEAKTSFTLSDIYKPILQMMSHFHENRQLNVSYRLFAYFPGKTELDNMIIDKSHVTTIMESLNKDLVPYVSELKHNVDIDAFLSKFAFEFGQPLDGLINNVVAKFENCGFEKNDITNIIYPNAMHIIGNISIKHDQLHRRVTKAGFLKSLAEIKKTIISRWTLLLFSVKQILDARRKQLKQSLSRNVRRRYFLISDDIRDFEDGIVIFISEFVKKYHFKAAHTETPLFCLDCYAPTFEDIRQRIHLKGISFNDGYIGSKFDRSHFCRNPIVVPSKDNPKREFLIRLARFETDPDVINTPKSEDIFVIGAGEYSQIDRVDVNDERLAVETLQQAKYILGVSDAYE